MKVAKALGRILLLVTTAAVLSLVYGLGLVFVGASKRTSIRLRMFLVRVWGHISSRGIGMKFEVEGPIPKAPLCLVSNHLSYIDILVFQRLTGSVLISKSEVASLPVVGHLGRICGTIFIDRKRIRDVVRVSAELQSRLELGDSVVFFPEATSTNGSAVLPFKSSLLNYFSEASYPVHYASIRYHSSLFDVSDKVCWWGDMTFGPHIWHLLQQPSFTCHIKFGTEPVTDSDRKALTQTLYDKIVQSFVAE